MARDGGIKTTLVAAVAENGVIGANGGLAWKISDDLKWFRKATMGKPIIMGRKTFESIGRALPGRDNIVATRSITFDPGGVFIVGAIGEALRLARACALKSGAGEICIIGGGEIYAQTIDLADRIYLTRIDAKLEGDVYFPPLDWRAWTETPEGGCRRNERNSHDCRFFILDRREK